MRIHLLRILLLMLPCYAQAQTASISYFIKQLNKRDQPDLMKAYFNIKLGDLYADNNPSQALVYSRKAFQLTNGMESDWLIYSASSNMGKSFLNIGQFDSSLFYAKQCNEVAKRLQDPFYFFKALNLLGSIYLEKNEISKAKKAFDEALTLSAANLSMPHLCRLYHNLGNYYFKLFEFKKSIEILKLGETIALKSNDQEDIMNIYSNLGKMYALTGNIDSAQYYILPALDYYHKKGNIRKEALINQNLGIAFGIFHNFPKMEQSLDKAYVQFKKAGDPITAGNMLIVKLGFYFQFLQFDKCMQALNSAEMNAVQNNQPVTLNIIYNYKSVIFSLLHDTTDSRLYQKRAEKIGGEINSPAMSQLNKTIKAVLISSRLKLSQGDTAIQKSLLEAKKMIPYSVLQTTLESITLNKDIVESNKKAVSDMFHTLLSSDSLNHKLLYDSLINQPINANISALQNKQLMELETKYQTKQKDDSIQSQSQLITLKNKSISTRNYFLAGLAILAFFILLLFLRSNSQAKKINRQYTEIQQLQSELTHRTGNFFNSIKGMLAVASATTTDNKTVSSLNSRVATINHLYTTLYSSPGKSQLPFNDLIVSICNDFERSFGSEKQIKVYHQANAAISKEEAVPLAFIITELLTNAEKYAFEGKETGEIHVEVAEDKDKRVLHVWDNGKGKDENTKARQGSQGMSIIKSYSKNLEGTYTSWNDNGFHFKMEF